MSYCVGSLNSNKKKHDCFLFSKWVPQVSDCWVSIKLALWTAAALFIWETMKIVENTAGDVMNLGVLSSHTKI